MYLSVLGEDMIDPTILKCRPAGALLVFYLHPALPRRATIISRLRRWRWANRATHNSNQTWLALSSAPYPCSLRGAAGAGGVHVLHNAFHLRRKAAENRFHLLHSLLGLLHVMHQVGKLVAHLL